MAANTRFRAVYEIYAQYADHPHAPLICIQAKKALEEMGPEPVAIADEPAAEYKPAPRKLEPVDLFGDAESEPTPEPLILVPPEPEPEAEPELTLVVVPVEDENQGSLFGGDDLQPVMAEAEPAQMIYVHFEDLADLDAFGRLIGQPVTTQTRLIEFPLDRNHFKTWREQNGIEGRAA